jgi:hypothetical protein
MLLRINPVILSCCFHFTLPDWLKLVALSESLAIQFGDAGRPELDAGIVKVGIWENENSSIAPQV